MKRAGRWFVLLVVRLAEHEGLADASAGAGELDEASVVDDAVDDRGGEFVVGEDRPPSAELFCFNVCSTGSAVFFRSVG